MEGKKQSIQITIADKTYPFSIVPEDEEVIRLAVKRISERLDSYKKKFSINDNQDALAVTVLQFVVQLIKEKKSDNSSLLLSEIQSLDNQLGEYIESNF